MRNAIQISGGIDSLALLFFLRPLWEDSLVMWVDPGASYDDVHELMDRISQLVPHFMLVRGNQPGSIRDHGYPVDVVPVSHTREGEMIYGPQPVRFQSYLECCARSRFKPLEDATLASGVTVVYRGQRDDEVRRARIPNGHVDEHGIRYVFPIHDWSRARVFDYMRHKAPQFIPKYYAQGERTSRDCWNCTAYRNDNVERVQHLPTEQRVHVERVLKLWRATVQNDMQEVHDGLAYA